MTASATIQGTYLTAIVHGPDGVRYIATADDVAALTAQIVGYVEERCDFVLWPSAAREVRALIDGDKPSAAITTYFAEVGDRWDEERLELGGLSLDGL